MTLVLYTHMYLLSPCCLDNNEIIVKFQKLFLGRTKGKIISVVQEFLKK